mmetsp:Transcript_9791/g.18777  ORF Transcript_9791/g.18777 Transcript_9791/m.18777 type:complete len:226 (-) Transcript_9791:314-991(-)
MVVFVYGEPAACCCVDRYSRFYPWHHLLAKNGFVVATIDPRGSPAPRGRKFRKCVYKKIGIQSPDDISEGVKALQNRYPFISDKNVGIWGWSGGGSTTLHSLFRHGDVFKCGVAIAFVAHQKYYDTIYQERYMGLIKENAYGYTFGSAITHVKGLQGDLMLIYGTADDNCHYQNCEALLDALVAHNKYYRLLSYPNRTHGLGEGSNTHRHMFTNMLNFFLEKLKP